MDRNSKKEGSRMKTALLIFTGLLLWVTPASAGTVETREDLVKQTTKLAPHVFDNPRSKTKLLCICHTGLDGDGVMGYVAHNVVFDLGAGGDRVKVDCFVPTYNFATSVVLSAPSCVGGGIGTFWELVK
jgi:hypothetical protein